MPYTDRRDRALAYGIYGGTPSYLASLDPGRPLAENVANDVLSPRGAVRLQVQTALDQEQGLREVGRYKAILLAIAAEVHFAHRQALDRLARSGHRWAHRTLRHRLDTDLAAGVHLSARQM